jgi:hypothetical protein
MNKLFSVVITTLFVGVSFFSAAQSSYAECKAVDGSFDSTCTKEQRTLACKDVTGDTNDNNLRKACDNSITFSPISGGELPTFATLVEFLIKGVFLIAGILALVQLIRGALDYIQSGGDAKKTEAAQNRIRDAVVGAILVVIVFAIAAFLESFLGFGLGITKPLIIPSLIKQS